MRCKLLLLATAFVLALAAPTFADSLTIVDGQDYSTPITLTNPLTVSQNGGSGAISGAISETGGSWNIIKDGAGMLSLTAANTYTGGTTISNGTLQIGNGGTVGSVMGNIVDNGTLIFNRSNSYAFGGAISGAGYVTVAGGGTVSLTGSQTYAGATTIQSGSKLALTAASNVSVTLTSNSVIDNGIFDISGVANGQSVSVKSLLGSGQVKSNCSILAFSVPDCGVLNITEAGGTFSGGIGSVGNSSRAALTISGGTQTLSGTSSAIGFLTIASGATLNFQGMNQSMSVLTVAGTVNLSGSAVLGQGSRLIINGGTLDLGGTTQTYNNSNLRCCDPGITLNGGTIQNGTLTTQTPILLQSGTVSAVIARGAVTVRGGAVVLSGANTYSYGTQIDSGGTLQIAGAGTLGAATTTSGYTPLAILGGVLDLGGTTQTLNGSVVILSSGAIAGTIQNGTLISGGTVTLSGAVVTATLAGSASLSVASPSTLSSVSSFTGSTNLNCCGSDNATRGTLSLVGAGSIASSSGLVTNAGTTFDISGTTSGTSIQSLAGSGSVVLGGKTLTITNAAADTFSGAIAGTGGLAVSGGSETLSGSNTYSGGTTVSGGTLLVSGSGSLGAASGSLTVSGGTLDLGGTAQIQNGGVVLTSGTIQNGTLSSTNAFVLQAGTVNAVLAGAGGVQKTGGGTVTLAGTNTYTGGTSVNAGTLNVNGRVGAVMVASGGALAGTGTVGSTTIANGATLSPGVGGAGTLTVQGNLALASGANYAVSLAPSTSTLTSVTGTAALNGNLVAALTSATYVPGQRYTLLSAVGGVSGTFSSVTLVNLPAYVKGRTAYDANDAYLFLDPTALTPLLPAGATANQAAIAGGIDSAVSKGANATAFNSLYLAGAAPLGGALNQLSGEVAADAAQASSVAMGSYFDLLTSAPGQPSGIKPAQLGSGPLRLWVNGLGGHAVTSADAASGAARFSGSFGGVALGVETQLDDTSSLGASLGYTHQDFSTGTPGGGNSDLVTISLYGNHRILDRGYVAAALGYGWDSVQTSRTVSIAGSDVLGADFSTRDIGGRIEAGYRADAGASLSLTPYGALSGQSVDMPAFSETARSGTANFALSYAADTRGTLSSELGARLQTLDLFGPGVGTLGGRVAWAHDLQQDNGVVAAFQALPGSTFQVSAPGQSADAALLGASLDVDTGNAVMLDVAFNARLGPKSTAIWGKLGLSYTW